MKTQDITILNCAVCKKQPAQISITHDAAKSDCGYDVIVLCHGQTDSTFIPCSRIAIKGPVVLTPFKAPAPSKSHAKTLFQKHG